MKKVLFTATVDLHILHFHIPYLKYFKENGYEVHVATNGDEEIPYCDVKHVISFERNPIKINNLKAIKELKKIIDEEKYEIIHCHTPMGSVVTRLAAKKARNEYNTKVIYTAHGFHFFKGAPVLNWALYYPIEKWMSKYTDCLITINEEDYNLAKKKFKAKRVELINGVGVDKEKFDFEMTEEEKENLRNELGVEKNDFVLLIVGELNKNKNQIMAINAVKQIVSENKNIKLLLAGTGELEEKYRKIIKNENLEDNIKMLGYRKDIPQLLKISNVLLSLSHREGLPVNVIEGLIAGLPVIATDCRGNRDLVKNEHNGYIIKNEENLVNRIKELSTGRKLEKSDMTDFEREQINKKIEKIYIDITKNKVMHILASDRFSGAESVAISIINKMKEKKVNSIYVSLDGPIRDKLKKENIEFIPIKKVSVKEIKRICKQYSPDVIHAHDFTTSVIASFSNLKPKVISHLHHNADWIRKINIKSLLYLISSIKYNKIILVSDAILKQYIFSRAIENKSVVLGNPIDSNRITEMANECKLNKEKFDIIFIGRLEYEKDPIRFIEIVKKVSEKNNIKATIIGEGSLKEACLDKIKELQLSNTIKLLGFLDNPYGIIANSKILCMTSKWEGFGLVATEALALGVPVVATNVGGIPMLVDNSCGMICDEDIEFSEEINKLMNDAEYYSEKSQNAICKSKKLENINQYIDMLFNIYVARKG